MSFEDREDQKWRDKDAFHKKIRTPGIDSLEESEIIGNKLDGVAHYARKAAECCRRDDQEFIGLTCMYFYKEKRKGTIVSLKQNYDYVIQTNTNLVPERLIVNGYKELREKAKKQFEERKITL